VDAVSGGYFYLQGLFWNLTTERRRQTVTIAVLALAFGLALARQNGGRIPKPAADLPAAPDFRIA
jgi:hypothetical protein